MSNIHLYTTFYPEKIPDRLRELLLSLKKNIDNSSIKSINVFNEGGDLSAFKSSKLQIVPMEQRPTYQDFINHINANLNQDDIHIIANTDIYFDKNIKVLQHINLKDTCLALSRWDTTNTIKPKLYNRNDSQDVWIFKGPVKQQLKADFPLGVPRCDNRLMYQLQEAGYKVLNPAFSIKAFHTHKGQRALVYTEGDNLYNIKPPYRYLYSHNLYGFWKTCFFNLTHKEQIGVYHYDAKKLNNWWVIRLPRKLTELITNKKMPLIGY
tara:strand:+ start:358 stop:1155 length:798 start_codon:yes stop_codon:yes gene_type:complete